MTLRDLVAMAEARERSEWTRTSTLLALVANAHRDAKKTRPFKPSDFDPFAKLGETTNDIPALRALFQTGETKQDMEADEG